MAKKVQSKELVATMKDGIKELGIFAKDSDAWVGSRTIAEMFGKEHKHIMESIREQILPNVSEDFGGSNFRPSSYFNLKAKEIPRL